MSARLFLVVLIAGSFWGGFGWLLGARALGPSIWGGVVARPLIGVAVAALVHPRFLAARGWTRGFWTLGSVYLGATYFSVACAVLALIRSSLGGGVRLETLERRLA